MDNDERHLMLGRAIEPILAKLRRDLEATATVTDPRERVALDLAALRDMLEAIAMPGDACSFAGDRVMSLAAQLLDLDAGNVGALLQPHRRENRPPMSFRGQVIKLNTALAMEALMRQGAPREDAARRVARMLETKRIRVSAKNDKPITWDRIARWRDELNAGPKDVDQPTMADVQWSGMMDRLRSGEVPRDDAAERFVAELPRLLARGGF
jgi:hypothetical protein